MIQKYFFPFMSYSHDKEEILHNFAKNVRRYRVRKGLTQLDLSAVVDIDLRQIKRYEGATSTATIVYACRIADALDVSVDDLLRKSVDSQRE